MMKLKYIFFQLIIVVAVELSLISCVNNDDYSIPPIPASGFFKETFNKVTKTKDGMIISSPWPKISAATNFDGEAEGAVYSDPYGLADVRKLNGSGEIAKKEVFVWFPANKESSLIIRNIRLGNRKNITLRYNFNANIYNSDDVSNTNRLKIKFNEIELSVPAIQLNVSNNKNKYKGVMIRIPEELVKEFSTLEFISEAANNDRGFRVDDIELVENFPSYK
jgi:hypothetical protein